MENINPELAEDLELRGYNLQRKMQEIGADACLLGTNVNLLYTTGYIYGGYAYIPAEGKPVNFIKRANGVTIENTVYIRKPEQITEELQKLGLKIPEKVLLEVDLLPYSEYTRIIKSFGNPEVINASVFMRNLRSVKTDYEVKVIRECAKVHVEVYKKIPSLYRKGMTDLDLQVEIEHLMRLHGSIGIFRAYGTNMDIFMGSLLVGDNAQEPSPFDFALGGKGIDPSLPIGIANVMMKEGQTFMVDFAGNYSSYITDISRVYSIGKTDELAYKAHQVSIDIHNFMRETIKEGTVCSDIYEKSLEIVKQHRLEKYFMGTKQQAKFVGHGIGLEINEPPVFTPRSNEILQKNIIFALEPKFVIPGIGPVGIENTYLVTDNGIENLTVLEEEIIEL